jgi:thiamine biosynthesis lipoprotein
MGCPCEVWLYARSRAAARRGFLVVEQEVRRLDRKYSHYRADSLLARLQRQAAGPGGVEVDEETASLLNYAQTQYEVSGGRFDVTSGRLSRLWDRVDALPDPAAIDAALENTGWDSVHWDGKVLKLPPEMRLDLGGLVKEYAADRAAALLKRAGFCGGYVDLGGDMHFLGPHPDGSPWQAGIRHPGHRDRAVAMVAIRAGGLASSGDYERFSEIDGRRYGHIIDPRTGWPVDGGTAGLAAASATAPSCLLAGSASTLAMLLGRKHGIPFLRRSGLPWLTVTAGGTVSGTLG